MVKKELLYDGTTKRMFATQDPNLCILEYKDNTSAFNGLKHGAFPHKGAINNQLTNHFMQLLEQMGIPTHFVQMQSPQETVVKKLTIFPLQVMVRNAAAGSLAKRLGLEEGVPMKNPILEFAYKNEILGDPMVCDCHIFAMDLCGRDELEQIRNMALQINIILTARLKECNINLVDFKLEFGKTDAGEILVADEISPDTCRLWDRKTNERLDKDRFRRDLGNEEGAYREVFRRVMGREVSPCTAEKAQSLCLCTPRGDRADKNM